MNSSPEYAHMSNTQLLKMLSMSPSFLQFLSGPSGFVKNEHLASYIFLTSGSLQENASGASDSNSTSGHLN